METKFQTSFIPKKQSVMVGGATAQPRKRGTSFFMGLGTAVFIISLVGAGGAYTWKQVLLSQQTTYKNDLTARQQQFNIDLIEQLKQTNVQIDLASQILSNHLAASQVFGIISRLTIENVRFLSMDLTAGAAGDPLKLSMQGYGTNLAAVAFQSDVLSQLEQYGLRKVVKNPILSDPSVDSNKTVSFGFTATIDPSSISYEKAIAPAPAAATSTSPSPSAPAPTPFTTQ